MTWTERVVDRSPNVQRSRIRSIEQARIMVEAGRRLVRDRGTGFTIQELTKEAGVALDTFYRHFASKDELLLAVLEEQILRSCESYAEKARRLSDPIARLRSYLTTVLTSLDDSEDASYRRFTTAEHFRLLALFPDEVNAADRRFTDLLVPEIESAAAAGLLRPSDVEGDAWFVTQLIMAIFHNYSFATPAIPVQDLVDRIWNFCIAALGGDPIKLDTAAKKRSSTKNRR